MRPRRVALVGASERNAFLNDIVANMDRLGYPGEIYYVNPNRDKVNGQTCYPSLAALPHQVDSTVISVPGQHVPAIVAEGLREGVGGFMVHSAGFAEATDQGRAVQAEMARMCRAAGAALIGPNCLGLLNLKDRVALYGPPVPATVTTGPVAVVAQSGSASLALMNNGRNLGFSYIASTGNEAVLTAEDLIEFYVGDKDTRIILAFIESLRQPRKFVEVARRAMAAGKPIIALKVGLTARGGRVSRGHSGGLAGSGRVHEAVFRQLGVVQVYDYDEMVETAELFCHTGKLPGGPRAAVFGISGGENSMIADLSESIGLELPEFAPETAAAIHKSLNLSELVPVVNPLDVANGYSLGTFEAQYRECLLAVDRDPGVDMIAVADDAPGTMGIHQLTFAKLVSNIVIRTLPELQKPMVYISHLSAGFNPEIAALHRGAGIPILQGTREGLTAMRNLGWYAERRAADRSQPYTPDPSRVKQALAGATAGQEMLGERAAKLLLSEYGIPVTKERLATSAGEAAAIAREIGFPVVLKIESPDVVHKTDVGGVRLGLNSPEEVALAYNEIVASVRQQNASARIAGVLVAEQVPSGVELIVGLNQDPQFGPVLLVGLGGVLVEVLNQVSLMLPPLTHSDARRVLETFPGHEVLGAFRGRPAADIDAVADVLVRISHLALDGEGLFAEMDINPLVVGAEGRGCRVLDARVMLDSAVQPGV